MTAVEITLTILLIILIALFFAFANHMVNNSNDNDDKIEDAEARSIIRLASYKKDIESRIKKCENQLRNDRDEFKEFDDIMYEFRKEINELDWKIMEINKVLKAIEKHDPEEPKELMTNDEIFKLLFNIDVKKARESYCSIKDNDTFDEWRNKKNKNTKMLKKKYVKGRKN